MSRSVNKINIFIACVAVMIFMMSGKVFAANANVSVSSTSGNNGDTVSVTVNVTGDEDIAMVNLWLSYDASVLEYVSGADIGGGGSVHILSAENSSFTLKFKAINAGNAAVAVNTSQSVVSSLATDYMAISASAGQVSVKAPASYSTNNNLSSLAISPGTLTPAFSKDVTTYNASVAADCTRLVVSAVAEDSKAKITTWGAALDPGDNTTKITVTAEDGSKKVYVIYTKRAIEQTQAAKPETNPGDNKPEDTQNNTEPSTEALKTDVTVNIEGQDYFVVSNFDEKVLPEGYEAVEYTFGASQVVVGKGIANGVTLFYLETATDEGGNKSFFKYDETTGTFTPYITLISKNMEYTVITENVPALPGDYVSTTLESTTPSITVWVPNNSSPEYFLFYGMNINGNTGWYQYSIAEGTIMKAYVLDNNTAPVIEREPESSEAIETVTTVTDDSENLKLKFIIGLLGVLLLIVVIILICIIIKLVSSTKEKNDIDDNTRYSRQRQNKKDSDITDLYGDDDTSEDIENQDNNDLDDEDLDDEDSDINGENVVNTNTSTDSTDDEDAFDVVDSNSDYYGGEDIKPKNNNKINKNNKIDKAAQSNKKIKKVVTTQSDDDDDAFDFIDLNIH